MEWGRPVEGPNQGAAGNAPGGGEAAPGTDAQPEAPRRWATPASQAPTGDDRPGPGAPAPPPSPASSDDDPFAERPEVFVGAAFVGGFALAQILKRLGP